MSTNDKLREARTAAEEFAKGNASECAAEIINWQDTAILKDGKVRNLAVLCAKYVGGDHALQAAESLIHRACMERAALASKPEPPLMQKSFDELVAERRASKPEPQAQATCKLGAYECSDRCGTPNVCCDHYVEPQAQAAEPEVIAVVTLTARTVGSEVKSPAIELLGDMPPVGTELIILQAHREAMAEITQDRDEWRQQHENLLTVKQQDNAALSKRIQELEQAVQFLTRQKTTPPDELKF